MVPLTIFYDLAKNLVIYFRFGEYLLHAVILLPKLLDSNHGGCLDRPG